MRTKSSADNCRVVYNTMTRSILFALVFATVFAAACAEFGPCRYDPARCSCKIGSKNQGVCWDTIKNTPGQCTRRSCKADWTCACSGRTHVCYRADRTANKVAVGDELKTQAACKSETVQISADRELSLGTFTPSISRKGTLSNDCNQLAWYHNGGTFPAKNSSV
jgi:hypothetical protein